MPTKDQIQRQAAAAKARIAFAAAEAALFAALAATPPAPASVKAALRRRDAAVADLETARAGLLTKKDPLGVAALDQGLPTALLPLRLETRRKGADLLVRIYPDDLHVCAHAEAVTAEELKALKRFLREIAPLRDQPPIKAAWLRLCDLVGVRRAAYLISIDPASPPGLRPGGLVVPARAALLPDRFVAYAWIDNATTPIRAEALAPVRDPLAVSPDPTAPGASGDGSLDQGALWMTRFDEAERAGMALRVSLTSVRSVVDRLVVLGVRASEGPASTAASLAKLIGGHEHIHGVDTPAPLTATNHLAGERAAYASRPDPEDIYGRAVDFRIVAGSAVPVRRPSAFDSAAFDTTTGRWAHNWRPQAAGFQLAQALGLTPEVFGFAAGAADEVLAHENEMTGVLMQAFGGLMRQSLAPGVNAAKIDICLDMLGSASGLGPLPALRLGRQPYGVLPVSLGDDAGLPADWQAVWRLIDQLRGMFEAAAVASAPRASGAEPADPMERLFAILQTEGLPFAATLRGLLRGDLATRAMAGLSPVNQQIFGRRRQGFAAALRQLGAPRRASFALTDFLFQAEAALIDDLSVSAGRPLDAPSRIARRIGERWSLLAILDERYLDDRGAVEAAPKSILYEILRQAVLEAADTDTRYILLNYAGADPNYRVQDPAQLEPGGPLFEMRARLTHPAPVDMVAPGQQTTLSEFFSVRGRGFGPGATMGVFSQIASLARLTDDQILLLFSSGLGLLSHRLDAHYTARAHQRLVQIRGNPPPEAAQPDGFLPGLNIGAFGYLEAIGPAAGASAGHVLAPSVQHGVTAGVLLSADYARRQQTPARGDAYAVELSSRRVREAEQILDGVRQGQPLPALLGYRLERGLIEAGGDAPALISRLRGIANLSPPPLDAQVRPAPGADAVADGLAILNLATDNLTANVDLARLGTGAGTLSVSQATTLKAVLERIQDSLDATADCLLAESVHQLAGGNPERAAAAGDALSGAGGLPERLDVLHPPERGVGVTHRLLLDIPAGATPAAGWGRASPRAAADPDLNAWLSFLLPAPASIRVTAVVEGAAPHVLILATLLPKLDVNGPGLSALDLAFEAADGGTLPGSGLAARLAPAAAALLADAGVTAAFTLDWARSEAWGRNVWSLGEAVGVAKKARALWSTGRSLRSDDMPVSVGVDGTDLSTRVSKARSTLQTAQAAATSASAADAGAPQRRRAVDWGHALGYTGLTESSPPGAFAQAAAEFGARRDAAQGMPTAENLSALVGGGLPILARFTGPPAEFTNLFTADIGASASDLRAFVSRAARVRPPVAVMETLLTYADATGQDGARHSLAVGQWPPSTRPWVGLPGDHARGQTSFVCWRRTGAAGFTGPQPPAAMAGLFIDAWPELIPQAQADASVVFHTNAPSTAAPNAILLCVPRPGTETWSEKLLLDHVLEAVSLAKLRAAGPEMLASLDWLLPLLLVDDSKHQPSFSLRMLDEELA